MLEPVLEAYGFTHDCLITPFGNGLINHTWRIKNDNNNYILQRINNDVFKKPQLIAENISMISEFLSVNYPDYFFCTPVKTIHGNDIFYAPQLGYFRVFPFVKNSRNVNVVTNPKQAFQAAKKFGEFTRLLSAFPVNKLHITLKDFHNLSLRYNTFQSAIKNENKKRIKKSMQLIDFLEAEKNIVDEFEVIKSSADFLLRVTHHDTKISNVLFDEADNGICVIDLDTIMPGYFISDVGDMLRTYLSPVSEEERDFAKIEIREDYFEAIVKGYLSEMKNILTFSEVQHFVYAGKFMLYMQSLRFLSDYLNNDIYYGSKYEDHNFIRAQNQAHLLKLVYKKEPHLKLIVEKTFSNMQLTSVTNQE
ncbi:MAG: phosphotransferase enzyme family protein [Chitinophagaceae bacterium]